MSQIVHEVIRYLNVVVCAMTVVIYDLITQNMTIRNVNFSYHTSNIQKLTLIFTRSCNERVLLW